MGKIQLSFHAFQSLIEANRHLLLLLYLIEYNVSFVLSQRSMNAQRAASAPPQGCALTHLDPTYVPAHLATTTLIQQMFLKSARVNIREQGSTNHSNIQMVIYIYSFKYSNANFNIVASYQHYGKSFSRVLIGI